MNSKFDKVSTRMEKIDWKAEAAESLAKQDHNNITIPEALRKKISIPGEENT